MTQQQQQAKVARSVVDRQDVMVQQMATVVVVIYV
jgi:hypothetical protein